METTIDEPFHVHGAGGFVTLNGPDGLVATMSAEIAQQSAELLLQAAEQARISDEHASEESR
ncbi:hypothetical protein SPAN111604_03940 [Sphingomonas antarctica]|uniref:hypothetical protein n=1 Tax=Sphingomonas antarctica TaxID=2040274 RepID=UPI0039E86E4E